MMTQRLRAAAVAGMTVAALGLAGCSGEITSVDQAQAQVKVKEKAVIDAEANLTAASQQFCENGETYIMAIDRYSDVLNDTAPTVGDVKTGGSDLLAPQDDAFEGAEDAVAAQQDLVTAQQELANANTRLERLQAGISEEPSASASAVPSPEPLAPAASVERVKQAESEFADAQASITDQTPLVEASQMFHSAAVGLQLSWLRLVVDANCVSDKQVVAAEEIVSAYTTALQQDLADAGYYSGAIDGIYGPETVAAIDALQEANELPLTGTMNLVTSLALQAELIAAGDASDDASAQFELATTIAVQQTLKILGLWEEPVDGVWTDELSAALMEFQETLGVKPTGELDAATVTAFTKALEEIHHPSPSPTPSLSPSITPSV